MSLRYPRYWWVVRKVGETNPIYLVSACSLTAVHRYCSGRVNDYQVKVAKVWDFMKVMCRYPIALPPREELAPNEWEMEKDFENTKVIILN